MWQRVYAESLREGESVFFRILLLQVKAAGFFADISIINYVQFQSVRRGCKWRGLLANDGE